MSEVNREESSDSNEVTRNKKWLRAENFFIFQSLIREAGEVTVSGAYLRTAIEKMDVLADTGAKEFFDISVCVCHWMPAMQF